MWLLYGPYDPVANNHDLYTGHGYGYPTQSPSSTVWGSILGGLSGNPSPQSPPPQPPQPSRKVSVQIFYIEWTSTGNRKQLVLQRPEQKPPIWEFMELVTTISDPIDSAHYLGQFDNWDEIIKKAIDAVGSDEFPKLVGE